MTTFSKQIAYGKRREAELMAILANPEAAKALEDVVLNGNALLSLLDKGKNCANSGK